MPAVRALDLFSGNFDHLQLKQCLHSPDTSLQIAAVKHILASITVAKDMSMHFSEVAKLVSSPNFEVKKLVYLYLMHNAKSQPEKVVLYAGTFVRDTLHESPLIRGIALRTMTSLQVPAMVDFAHGVVLRCLAKKEDPYVKRNATVAVLKLHRVSPTIITEAGILHALIELLSDPVATVVAGAACSLVELLQDEDDSDNDTIHNTLTAKCDTLLAALTEASEWSQVYLLNALTCIFKPRGDGSDAAAEPKKTPAEAETIITRVAQLLQSSNPAVVMAATRLLVNLLLCYSPIVSGVKSPLSATQQAAFERSIGQKIASPLVSMLSGLRFEIRYVALRSIKVLLHRCKEAFVPFVSQFFVKFDDPIYIKLEKVDIMLALSTRANAELVLSEFAEYSQEVDTEVVRRAVRSIGVLAVRVASVTPQCVERLVQLIDSKVNFVVQEAAVVVQQVLRQYPSSYEAVIAKLCGALKVLDEPESKAAVVWVIGEYGGKRIANASEILQVFLENFAEEALIVQRAVLTAAMKVYLSGAPAGGGSAAGVTLDQLREQKTRLIEQVFGLCTSSGVPDLRDRAFFYWRLLRADPSAAQKVVCAQREQIVDPGFLIQDRSLLSAVLADLGNLTAVCMQPARALFGDGTGAKVHYDDADEGLDAAEASAASASGEAGTAAAAAKTLSSNADPTKMGAAAAAAGASLPVAPARPTLVTCLDAAKNSGFSVQIAWFGGGAATAIAVPTMRIRFALEVTSSRQSVKVDLLQLDGNALGLGLAKEFSQVVEVKKGDAQEMELTTNANNVRKPTMDVNIAMRTDPLGVVFFKAPPVPLELVLNPSLPAGYDSAAYARDFSRLTVVWSLPADVAANPPPVKEGSFTGHALQLRRLHLIHRNDQPPLVGMHVYANVANGASLFCEITLENNTIVLVNVKAEEVSMAESFGKYVLSVIKK